MKRILFSLLAIAVFSFSALAKGNFTSLKGKTNKENQSSTIKSIQHYLDLNHEKIQLYLEDLKEWEITDDYFSPNGRIRHVYLRQTINGIGLLNGVANVTMNEKDSVFFVKSNFVSQLKDKLSSNSSNSIDVRQAISLAAQHLKIDGQAGKMLESSNGNSYKFEKGTLSAEPIEVSNGMWFNGEEIRATWVVSILEQSGKHWWQLFVDAESGMELNKIDWVTNCSFEPNNLGHQQSSVSSPLPVLPPPGTDQYNVFPFPAESPNHGSSSLEVGPSNAIASPFGWHDTNGVSGPEFTITRGNNVFAYEDVGNANVPGFSPDGGANLDFNFAINLNQNPVGYQSSSITNLFYANNRIHDILYQYGFDEASGNFQSKNYSGNGQGQDHVLAEAQDGGGTSNANFSTPPDGSEGRMQMYIWPKPNPLSNLLLVNSPSSVAGSYSAASALFGPGVNSTPVTADLELMDDGVGTFADGCEPAINGLALNGKIVVIYRGSCNFITKVANAQTHGALAVIVINNAVGAPFAMGGTDPNINIPSIMISDVDGAALVNEMANATLNATIVNSTNSYDKDCAFDNGIIAHEYGHGVSNRLTGGPSNTGCLSNVEQMGEGWSDFISLMLTQDPSVSNPVHRPVGTYVLSEQPNGNGIRNAPYDTSFAVNSYTYGDVADASNISLPHGIGFIWCSMLWDLNWAFINLYGFDANIETGTGGNNQVLNLVIEAMKLQPCLPGFVDGRDAILEADQLLYGGVNHCLIWTVFAKRGLGFSAQQGSSNNRSDQVEAFNLPISCQNPTLPPVADFSANTLNTCDGEVYFTDRSTEVPQSWLWNFGDGDTSTQQNPIHVYRRSGNYTVSLEVNNSIGNNIKTLNNYITVSYLDAPNATDGFGCPNDSILLTATGSNVIHWLDSMGNEIKTGNSIYAPSSNTSRSYFAYNIENKPVSYVGPLDGSIGTGAYHNTSFAGAINFTAEKKFIIYSTKVDAETAGMRQIILSRGFNSIDNPMMAIDTVNVNIPFIGSGRIDLGILVPGQGQYCLGIRNAGLYRNSTGGNYPYTIPGLMSIVSSPVDGNPLDFYYYFYNLAVGEPDCISDTIAVTANVLHVDFNWVDTGGIARFTNLSNLGSSWSWDFGDGDSSNLENPIHTYLLNGRYTVKLTVDGLCLMSHDIDVSGVGIDERKAKDLILSVYPNPAQNQTKIIFKEPLKEDANIKVISLDGKVLREFTLKRGNSEILLSLKGIASQMCYVRLISETVKQEFKLLIE